MTKKALVGILRTQAQGEELISELQANGFAESDVSVLFPGHGQARDFAIALGSKSSLGAVLGGAALGLLGAMTGLLGGMGAMTFPGLGLLAAGGPLLAMLSGLGAGGVVGAIVGGLIGLGIPELRAHAYEGKLRGGTIVLVLHTEDSRQLTVAKQIFRAAGAEDVSVTTERAVPGGRNHGAPDPTPSAT
jgi:hypothetical protein